MPSKAIRNFAHPLKALIKPLKRFEKPLTSRLSAMNFYLFNRNTLVYIFLETATFFFQKR